MFPISPFLANKKAPLQLNPIISLQKCAQKRRRLRRDKVLQFLKKVGTALASFRAGLPRHFVCRLLTILSDLKVELSLSDDGIRRHLFIAPGNLTDREINIQGATKYCLASHSCHMLPPAIDQLSSQCRFTVPGRKSGKKTQSFRNKPYTS